MITFLTGVPGSGKTYKAVNDIFNNFSSSQNAKKDLKKNYNLCYTNINEFNFDKLDNVYPLDFDDLKRNLTKLHEYYKDKKDDDFLIEKCKDYNIYSVLFVIDECHNFFDTKDTVLIWWLSYHRHLYHDIILITQNLSLVESKYKSFSEFFYQAKPTTVVLNRNYLVYDSFISSRLSDKSKAGRIKLKKNKEVFELYKSGDSVETQNVVLKYILYASFIFVFLFISFYMYIGTLKKDDSKPKNENYNTMKVVKEVSSPAFLDSKTLSSSFSYKDKRYFELSCNASYCYNEDISIPIALLTYFIKSNSITLLFSKKINPNYYKFYLDCSDGFYKFISKKRLEDEKGPINTDSIVPVFGGK